MSFGQILGTVEIPPTACYRALLKATCEFPLTRDSSRMLGDRLGGGSVHVLDLCDAPWKHAERRTSTPEPSLRA